MLDINAIAIYLLYFSAISSFIGGVLTLNIIYKINKSWNLYLQIIASLTISQMIYDFALFSFIILLKYFGESAFIIYDLLNIFGWSSATLWTNVLSSILLYTIFFLKSVSISNSFKKYFYAVYGFSLFHAIFLQFLNKNFAGYLENIFRFASIVYNIILYIAIYIKLINMKIGKNHVLFILSRRLKYYSLALILSRFFSTWYEIAYNFESYNLDPSNASFIQNFVFLGHYFCTPLAGVGYFIVFLHMQPDAWCILKSICCCCCFLSNNINNQISENNNSFTTGATSFGRNFEKYDNDDEIPTIYINNSSETMQLMNYENMDDDELFKQIELYFSDTERLSLTLDNL